MHHRTITDATGSISLSVMLLPNTADLVVGPHELMESHLSRRPTVGCSSSNTKVFSGIKARVMCWPVKVFQSKFAKLSS